MNTYEFSIIASGLDHQADDFETRFFEAGCDDAIVSFQKGHIIIDFARAADSVTEAIASAVENVMATGATIDRIEPDPLVSLSDIAARSAMSRSAMTLYAKGERAKDFPAPVARVTSESPLWNWAVVARWLFINKKVSKEVAIEAEAFYQANEAIEVRDYKIRERLGSRIEAYEHALC